jgi:ankyrin repeat protein
MSQTLPTEIIDLCILYTGDFSLALKLGNQFAINKLYNPKIHNWANVVSFEELTVAKWLFKTQRNDDLTCEIAEDAALTGNFDLLKFFHYNDCDVFNKSVMDNASLNERMDIVRFLNDNRTEGCSSLAIDDLCVKGDLESVIWFLLFTDAEYTESAINWASEYGNLEIVEFLVEVLDCEIPDDAIDWAIETGNYHCMKYLVPLKPSYTCESLSYVCSEGRNDIIEYLLKNTFVNNSSIYIDSACFAGQVETVIFLLERTDFIFSKYILSHAITMGHMPLIKCLVEKKKVNFYKEAVFACIIGDSNIIKYFVYRDPGFITSECIIEAYTRNHYRILGMLLHYSEDSTLMGIIINNEHPVLSGYILNKFPELKN